MRQQPRDPDGLNQSRAAWADAAIKEFQRQTKCDLDDALADLLADLRHWADRWAPGQFSKASARARYHYLIETGRRNDI